MEGLIFGILRYLDAGPYMRIEPKQPRISLFRKEIC